MVWPQLVTLLVLGIIAWEDLRDRSIHWWWLPVLAIVLAIPIQASGSVEVHLSQAGFNLSFLGAQFIVLLLVLMLRNRRWVDPFQYIGLGDVLFFVVLAVGLSPANFILFYLTGLALCVPAQLIVTRLRPTFAPTVPTAGFLAIYLIVWTVVDLISSSPGLHTGSVAAELFAHG